jgi:hypothetical protein
MGPAPKDPKRRAGHRKDPIAQQKIRFERAEQPPLPDDREWHPRTVQWWEMWRNSPQADWFMASDWDFLMDTAVMHHALWAKGQWTLAAEVRLRVAKYGATPEDRARLRMHFADADEKDSKRRPSAENSSKERFGDLHVLRPEGKEQTG